MSSKTAMSASLSSQTDLSSVRCANFGLCGGCSLQNQSYSRQIEGKLENLKKAFEPLGVVPAAISPSPSEWFYRNKMEFSFGSDGVGLALGLKAKGQWSRVLNLKECYLLSPEAPALLESVRNWALEEKLSVHDPRSHQGLLRHLVVRESGDKKERMVLLVSSAEDFPRESFVRAVLNSYPATGVLWGKNDQLSDTALVEELKLLWGKEFIVETLESGDRKLRYRVSPQSFFQSNTRASQALHAFIREKVKLVSPKLILDLYCGLGAITLSAADLCDKVIGLESVESSVVDARLNADENGIKNASFYSGLAETLLPALLAMSPELLIVDPPRSGIHPKALSVIEKANIPAILYVSCNPKTLLRDLSVLLTRYKPLSFEAFDFFPQTEHVETAIFLSHR